MAEDSEATTVVEELRRYGIRPSLTPTGSGHIQIRWRVGEVDRVVTTSKTGSDWRGRLNIRAEVRRMLRADNVHPYQNAGKTMVNKMFAIPNPVQPVPDQINSLRAEMDDLTSLLLELSDDLKFVRSVLTPLEKKAIPYAEPTNEEPVTKKRGMVMEVLGFESWMDTAAVAKALGKTKNNALATLTYHMGKGLVQRKGDHWRRARLTLDAVVALPPPVVPAKPAAVLPAKQSVQGRILAALSKVKTMSPGQIAVATGMTEAKVSASLTHLKAKGTALNPAKGKWKRAPDEDLL